MGTGFDARPRGRAGRPRLRGYGWRRAAAAGLAVGAVVLPLSAAARAGVPAPAPTALAPVTAGTLQRSYAVHRADAVRAARMAAAHGDRRRAAAERFLAAPSRRLLAFDGRGGGRATEVFGDPAHARRIAVVVPGSDTGFDTYGRFYAAAHHLYEQLARESGTESQSGSEVSGRGGRRGRSGAPAVVAWLGYETPGTVSPAVATTGRAEQAAPRLRALVGELRRVAGPFTHLTLVCHSYGTTVCGRAAAHLDVDDLVLVGSPGTGSASAAALRTPARVWAARGTDDWVRNVPHAAARLFGTTVGLGTDPVSPAFGARVFPAGDGGHSDYFTRGSLSLTNVARIAAGRPPEARGHGTPGADRG